MARDALYLVVTVFDVRLLAAVDEVFSEFPIKVGRGSSSDVQLSARSVSRHHGVFVYQPVDASVHGPRINARDVR